jgi:hypothetical protein
MQPEDISPSLRKRFEAKVDKQSSPSGCWLWTASLATNGYGQLSEDVGGKRHNHRAHRIAYLLYVGAIPDGFDLDHLCRNRCCVNPAHLEPVTRQENARRGIRGELTTHCPNGHEYTPENTWLRSNGHRQCRACNRERARARRRRGTSTD